LVGEEGGDWAGVGRYVGVGMEVGVPAKGGVVELVCESGVESLVGVEVFVDKAVE
jgi:hypothetical protein